MQNLTSSEGMDQPLRLAVEESLKTPLGLIRAKQTKNTLKGDIQINLGKQNLTRKNVYVIGHSPLRLFGTNVNKQ